MKFQVWTNFQIVNFLDRQQSSGKIDESFCFFLITSHDHFQLIGIEKWERGAWSCGFASNWTHFNVDWTRLQRTLFKATSILKISNLQLIWLFVVRNHSELVSYSGSLLRSFFAGLLQETQDETSQKVHCKKNIRFHLICDLNLLFFLNCSSKTCEIYLQTFIDSLCLFKQVCSREISRLSAQVKRQNLFSLKFFFHFQSSFVLFSIEIFNFN